MQSPNNFESGNDATFTRYECDFLRKLHYYLYFPVGRFVLKSSKDESFKAIMFQPIFILDLHQSMNHTKIMAKILRHLETLGYITNDYDIPLDGYEYNDIKNSDIYKQFCDIVEFSKESGDYLGDTPALECGSIALTEKGIKYVNSHF